MGELGLLIKLAKGEKVSLEQFAAASEAQIAGATAAAADSPAEVTGGNNRPKGQAAGKPSAFSWLSSTPSAAPTPAPAPEAKPESRSSWFGPGAAAKLDATQVAKSQPQTASPMTSSWFSLSAEPVNTAVAKSQPAPLRTDKALGPAPPQGAFEFRGPVEQAAKWGIALAILSGLVYHHQSAALAWPDFMVLYYTVLTAAIDPSIYTSRWGVSGAAVAGALGGCQAYQRYPLPVELASPPVAFVAVSMLLLLAASLLITDLATLQAPASTHLLLAVAAGAAAAGLIACGPPCTAFLAHPPIALFVFSIALLLSAAAIITDWSSIKPPSRSSMGAVGLAVAGAAACTLCGDVCQSVPAVFNIGSLALLASAAAIITDTTADPASASTGKAAAAHVAGAQATSSTPGSNRLGAAPQTARQTIPSTAAAAAASTWGSRGQAGMGAVGLAVAGAGACALCGDACQSVPAVFNIGSLALLASAAAIITDWSSIKPPSLSLGFNSSNTAALRWACALALLVGLTWAFLVGQLQAAVYLALYTLVLLPTIDPAAAGACAGMLGRSPLLAYVAITLVLMAGLDSVIVGTYELVTSPLLEMRATYLPSTLGWSMV